MQKEQNTAQNADTDAEKKAAVEAENAAEANIGAESEKAPDKDKEIAELQERLKRVAAETDNFRRRQEANFERRLENAKHDVFRKLLPIVDHLEMAINAAKVGGTTEQLTQGVELVLKDALKILEGYGVASIKAEGEIFDPQFHEAVLVQNRDDLPDETIFQELQKGYICGDKVLRPSMVGVARQSD